MIRRQQDGEYWLITQADHAVLSGQLARHIGNRLLKGPSGESATRGISQHDCGWPLHDDEPTMNARHVPLDVFESPREITLPVWEHSVERVMREDPYAAMLVSLHALALSVLAVEHSSSSSWNLADPRVRFEVNRFQHRMIEVQELLRQSLGMQVDLPLRLGLADGSDDPKEKQLVHDFRLLQAMDIVSLRICCSELAFNGYSPLKMTIGRKTDWVTTVQPWPFVKDQVQVQVPFRRIPMRPFSDVEEFRRIYKAAPIEQFTARVQNITI